MKTSCQLASPKEPKRSGSRKSLGALGNRYQTSFFSRPVSLSFRGDCWDCPWSAGRQSLSDYFSQPIVFPWGGPLPGTMDARRWYWLRYVSRPTRVPCLIPSKRYVRINTSFLTVVILVGSQPRARAISFRVLMFLVSESPPSGLKMLGRT